MSRELIGLLIGNYAFGVMLAGILWAEGAFSSRRWNAGMAFFGILLGFIGIVLVGLSRLFYIMAGFDD